MKRIVMIAVSAALIVGGATVALTQAGPTLSYQGVIEIGGEPLDGPLLLRFSVRRDDPTSAPVHCEEQTAMVTRGRFSVELGTGASVADCPQNLRALIQERRDLYITLSASNGDGFVDLFGAQRITSDGYALTALDNVGDVPVGAVDRTVRIIDRAPMGQHVAIGDRKALSTAPRSQTFAACLRAESPATARWESSGLRQTYKDIRWRSPLMGTATSCLVTTTASPAPIGTK
ncbi:MAG: hypothetical protein AAFX94_09975 [Myxococcota bacterium]